MEPLPAGWDAVDIAVHDKLASDNKTCVFVHKQSKTATFVRPTTETPTKRCVEPLPPTPYDLYKSSRADMSAADARAAWGALSKEEKATWELTAKQKEEAFFQATYGWYMNPDAMDEFRAAPASQDASPVADDEAGFADDV